MRSSLPWLPRNNTKGTKQRPPIPLEVYEAFSFSNSGTRGSPPALESQHASLSTPQLFLAQLSFLVYSSKIKPCSSWENFLGRVKGQSPDSVPFTLYTLAITLVSIRVISYPTIPLLFTWNLLSSQDPVSGTYICQVNEWSSSLDKKALRLMNIK